MGALWGVVRLGVGARGEARRGIAWVRDRGEHYLPRLLLLTGTSILAVELLGYLYMILLQFLCPFRLWFRFPSVLFGLASLLTSEIRFPLPDFFGLGNMRVALT